MFRKTFLLFVYLSTIEVLMNFFCSGKKSTGVFGLVSSMNSVLDPFGASSGNDELFPLRMYFFASKEEGKRGRNAYDCTSY